MKCSRSTTGFIRKAVGRVKWSWSLVSNIAVATFPRSTHVKSAVSQRWNLALNNWGFPGAGGAKPPASFVPSRTFGEIEGGFRHSRVMTQVSSRETDHRRSPEAFVRDLPEMVLRRAAGPHPGPRPDVERCRLRTSPAMLR